MDIVRDNKARPRLKRYLWVGAGAALIVVIAVVSRGFGEVSYIADGDNLLIGKVQAGDLSVTVRGHGALVPKDVRRITAVVDGHVHRVMVKAGARVAAGDALVELRNPKLHKQLEETRLELEALTAEHRATEVSLESELLALEDEVLNTRLAYDSAKLRLNAQTELMERAASTVSMLDYRESELTVDQHKERLQIQARRLEKMRENLVAQRAAHVARIGKMKNSLREARQQVDDLTVTASTDGVVQEMAIELGQQVDLGTHIARIARHDDLIAELKIQEIQVRDVAVGQPVVLDTRSSQFTGSVARIDPVVSEGVVVVDVEITQALPPEARPDLSVEGTIRVAEMTDVLYVERPVFAQSFARTSVFRLSKDGGVARRTSVALGRGSTRYIEVVSGLQAGDRIIVSDPSAWEDHQQIMIN